MKMKAQFLLPGVISLMLAASPMIPAFTNTAVAGYAGMGGKGMGMKANQLNLTDAQKARMREIRQSTRQQIDAVLTTEQKEQLRTARQQRQKGQRVNLNLTDDQKSRIQAIRQDAKSKMEAVLTVEQKQKLQELRAQWHQRSQR